MQSGLWGGGSDPWLSFHARCYALCVHSSAPLWVAQTKYRVLDTMLGRGSLAACGARSHFGHGGGAGVGRVRRARQGESTQF